jgi:hypothetical protein
MSEQETPVKIAGTYDLLTLTLASLTSGQSIGLKNTAHRFEIKESVDSTFLVGSITITDATGILKRLPITGNEILIIETQDYYGSVLKEAYKVFALSDFQYVSQQDQNLVRYTLHFCSREKFIADTFNVKRAYKGFIHNQALECFDEYITQYSDSELGRESFGVDFKGLTLQVTENEATYSIPNMKPDQAMDFFARRAYHSAYPAGVYKFWETRKGFHFLSLQGSEQAYRIRYKQSIPEYVYSTNFQNLPQLQDMKMKQILALGLNKNFNTIEAFKSGAYTSKVLELDVLNRTPIETRYNHVDELENNTGSTYTALNGRLYSKQNLRTINAYYTDGPEYLVIKDYPSVGTDTSTASTADVSAAIRARQEYAENTVKRLAYSYELEQNKIELTLHGSWALFAGAYIKLSIPSADHTESGEDDPVLSGYYLVHSCTHVYDGNEYSCKIIATRPGETRASDVSEVTPPNPDVNTTNAAGATGATDLNAESTIILSEFTNESGLTQTDNGGTP